MGAYAGHNIYKLIRPEMNVLIIQNTHISHRINGADMFDELLAIKLHESGYNVAICLASSGFLQLQLPYGVLHYWPQKDALIKKADIIFARSSMAGTFDSQGKPTCYFQHNCDKQAGIKRTDKVVYVAEHLKQSINYNCDKDLIFYPFNRYFGKRVEMAEEKDGFYLSNCNANKGGALLLTLANGYQNHKFVGIQGGYGNQRVVEGLPNLTYKKFDKDFASVLHYAKYLLMLSEFEGMPMAVLEAAALGIPTIPYYNPCTAFKEIAAKIDVPIKKYCTDTIGKSDSWDYQHLQDEYKKLAVKIEAERPTINELVSFVHS